MGRLTNLRIFCVAHLVVAGAALTAAPLASAGDFPYRAAVRAEGAGEALVHSGPGDDYYATDKLAPGDQVEVYRHDRGGWCAIRPPEGSFSWVLAKYLSFSKSDEGVARVVSDRCQSHVGTSLGDERDARQVQLSEGEEVAVLERGERWCKIAPPAGEFRWIRAKFLDPLDDESDGAARGAASGGRNGREEREPRGFDRRLATLDLELSAIVTRDTEDWPLDELLARVQDHAETAESPRDRDRAGALVKRIGKFLEIQRRHDKLLAEQESLQAPAQPTEPATRRGERSERPNQRTTADTRYDGVGRLQPVARRGGNSPQYALVDEAGGVLAYVNPGPGVNLAAFQNREVGVNGARNYITSIRKPLITAQRVTLLTDKAALRR